MACMDSLAVAARPVAAGVIRHIYSHLLTLWQGLLLSFCSQFDVSVQISYSLCIKQQTCWYSSILCRWILYLYATWLLILLNPFYAFHHWLHQKEPLYLTHLALLVYFADLLVQTYRTNVFSRYNLGYSTYKLSNWAISYLYLLFNRSTGGWSRFGLGFFDCLLLLVVLRLTKPSSLGLDQLNDPAVWIGTGNIQAALLCNLKI